MMRPLLFLHYRRRTYSTIFSRSITTTTLRYTIDTSAGILGSSAGTEMFGLSNEYKVTRSSQHQPHRFMSTRRMSSGILSTPATNKLHNSMRLPIQIRTMAGNKNKGSGGSGSPNRVSSNQRQQGSGNGGGNKGGKGSGGNVVKIQICHSNMDLEPMDPDLYDDDDDDDEYLYSMAKFNLKDIKAKVEEDFGTSETLEYYDGTNWKPLTRLDAISKYRGGEEPLKVRIPENYDDEKIDYDDYAYDDDPDKYDREDYDPERDGRLNIVVRLRAMIETIEKLVDVLKESGYERSGIKALTMLEKSTNKEISTKDWVLQQADKDPTMESVLLGQAGALDHIVQCLHYDVVWKPKPTLEQVEADTLDQDDDDDNHEHLTNEPNIK